MKAEPLSIKTGTRLAELHTDQTKSLILGSAIEMLETSTVTELTVRAVAKQAGISERTIFRYFATREEFLDAIAQEVTRKLNTPPAPKTLEDLLAFSRKLYEGLEAQRDLTRASLHTEIFHRIRGTVARSRWTAIQKVIDQSFPKSPPRLRKLAAANIRYFLSGTTWHYYRFYFGYDIEECIEAAELAIRQMLQPLK